MYSVFQDRRVLGIVLFQQSLAHAAQAQALAVHRDVYGFGVPARIGTRHFSILAPQLKMESAGTYVATPSRPMMEPIRHSA